MTTDSEIGFVDRPNCPACAGPHVSTLLRIGLDDQRIHGFLRDYYRGRVPIAVQQAGEYHLADCMECGLIYQRSVLNGAGLAALYDHWIDPAESLAKRRAHGHAYYSRLANEAAAVAAMIGKMPADTRVLDFGMGWGDWVCMADAHGFAACGHELSSSRVDHARERGVTVIDSVAQLQRETPFDYIRACQVLEHVTDPRATVAQLSELLAPRGVLDIHVPAQFGIRRRLKQKGWVPSHDAVHPLEHVNAFSRRSLRRLAEDHGMRLVRPPVPHRRTTGTTGVKDIAIFAYNISASTHVWFRKS